MTGKTNPLSGYRTAEAFTDYGIHTKWINGKRYLFNAKGQVYRKTGMARIALEHYYFNKDHSLKTGFVNLPDGTYYFGYDGKMLRSDFQFSSIPGNDVYMDGNGRQVKTPGWYTVRCFGETGRMYIRKNGKVANGIYKTKDRNYLFSDHMYVANGVATIDLRNKDGYFTGSAFYLAKGGFQESRPGWHTVNGFRYYVQKDGTLPGTFNTKDFKSYPVTRKIGKKNYIFYQGYMVQNTTFRMSEKAPFYYYDKNGQRVTKAGFYKVSPPWKNIFLMSDPSRIYKQFFDDSIFGSDQSKVFVREGGSIRKGWVTYQKNRYYSLGEDGIAAHGFCPVGNKVYYFDRNGKLVKYRGTKTIGGKTYIFNKDHSVKTGRFTHGKKKSVSDFQKPGKSGISERYAQSSGLRVCKQKDSKGNLMLEVYDKNGNLRKLVGRHTVNGFRLNFDKNHRAHGGKDYFKANYKGKTVYLSKFLHLIDGSLKIGKKEYLFKQGVKVTKPGWHRLHLTEDITPRYFVGKDGTVLEEHHNSYAKVTLVKKKSGK